MCTSLREKSDFPATVDWLYAGLLRAASYRVAPDKKKKLNGLLAYAGELDFLGLALAAAARVAGAACLSACGSLLDQKRAQRAGLVDIVAPSLAEALRGVLKIKSACGLPWSICVETTPETLERQMLELGVMPDLLPPGGSDLSRMDLFRQFGARQIIPGSWTAGQSLVVWSVQPAELAWMPRLDALAGQCLAAEEWAARRWLATAPGIFGRLGEARGLLRCADPAAQAFVRRVREEAESGRLPASVEISLHASGHLSRYRVRPQLYRATGPDRRPTQSGSKAQ